MALQIRRGLEASRTSITPVEGEFLYATDTKKVYIGDGSTAGGNPLGGSSVPVIDNIKWSYTTTATAAGITPLNALSTYRQVFTGTTVQTIYLPSTGLLTVGMSYEIENASTGVLTVSTSGNSTIGTIPPGVTAEVTCINIASNLNTSWDLDYVGFSTLTGTGSAVLATAPTISNLVLTGTLTANSSVGTSGQYLTSTGTGVQWSTLNTSALVTLTGTETLTNKTLSAPKITGSLFVNNVSGNYGQVLVSGGGGNASPTWTSLANLSAGSGISFSSGTTYSGTDAKTISLQYLGSSGYYGDSTNIPRLEIDNYGRVIGVQLYSISSGGSSFGYIQVGQSGPSSTTISAPTSGSVLTLIAGDNITLTGSPGSSSITIASTGGGGTPSGPVTTSIGGWWYSGMSGMFSIDFQNTSDRDAFLAAVTSSTQITFSGYSGSMYLGGTFTLSGSWEPGGSYAAYTMTPTPGLPIPSPNSDGGTGGTITYTGSGSSGGSAAAFSWKETTNSNSQGATIINYGPATDGQRRFVAFYGGSSMQSYWIGEPMSNGPQDPSWMLTGGSGMGWVVYVSTVNASNVSTTSQQWNFMNNNHMMYTTWTTTDLTSSMQPQVDIGNQSSSNYSYYINSQSGKTNTVLLGSTNSQLNFTQSPGDPVSPPPGYTKLAAKRHAMDISLSVAAYSNPTPMAGQTQDWYVNNQGWMQYNTVSVTLPTY